MEAYYSIYNNEVLTFVILFKILLFFDTINLNNKTITRSKRQDDVKILINYWFQVKYE
ncbi:hypothetical protein AAJ76_8400010433 [Vairimorpha ceranae]|uniref:Uncharacterized protein n=1 Tax=Vairimorpha ceranae TaxID=40302 RepID=A0A0F9YNQ0_9MICR|nr:hypothetical protein AAJ76_8400010433 [Vairimorpha ceranae]KKO74317.1 hypothetical protein AAJ76_8400010433 [Vairimorpha ceranae]